MPLGRLAEPREMGKVAALLASDAASEMGERYDLLIKHIIGFRACVTDARARFKLGQDEAVETLRNILAALPDADLADWMRRFNHGRLDD